MPPILRRLDDAAAWLDERLPAPGSRRAFRRWRRTRPFWGGVATVAGGATILLLPLAPLPVMIHVGTAAISGVAIGCILIAAGLFYWFAPAQRAFVAVVSTICALVSVVTTNLGGFGLGALLALLGSAMAFGWRPHAPAARRTVEIPASPDSLPADSSSLFEDETPPRVIRSPWFRRANVAALLPVMLTLGVLPAQVPQRNTPTTPPTCVPVPGATRPWWIPEWLWLICPSPSPAPGGNPTQPSPTPVPPTGGPSASPNPSGSAPPSGSAAPSGSTGPGASASAGVSLAPPPAMAAPGHVVQIRYGRNVPEVAADRLLATGFTFRGATNLPTAGGGSVKALVFHADNLKADNYRITTTDPGPRLQLGIDLDIDDVDIYATYLGGLITVPYLNVPLVDITLSASLIPTWLPLDLKLPAFSGDNVKAGQVFIRAGTVRGSHLSAATSGKS